MEIFDKILQVLRFLVECLSRIAMGGRYSEAKRLITATDLKMMLSYTSRDARNERDCGICFWTMSENAYISRPWMQFMKTWNF